MMNPNFFIISTTAATALAAVIAAIFLKKGSGCTVKRNQPTGKEDDTDTMPMEYPLTVECEITMIHTDEFID